MRKSKLFIILAIPIFLSISCANNPQIETPNKGGEVKNEQKDESKDNKIEEEAKEFVKNFSRKYPDYTLVDYVIGSEKNYPIYYVGVGLCKEKEDYTFSVFIAGDKCNMIASLGSVNVTYRKEDGLKLRDNVIVFSTDVVKDGNIEIEDNEFEVTHMNFEGGMIGPKIINRAKPREINKTNK